MPDKIQRIKDKGLFGNLIEVGCGCPVYTELCNHPNTASKIVNYAFSPNNWEFSKKMYGHGNNRAVSPEVIMKIVYETPLDDKVNFILVNTIQIANTSDVQTHGWFAMYSLVPNTQKLKLYHFTINYFRSRKEYIDIIAQIGIDILAACNNVSELDNGYIDIILDPAAAAYNSSNMFKFNVRDTLTAILNGKLNIENAHNTTLVLRSDGTIDRFNTLLRENIENLVIIKGSFNPVHPQHIRLLKSLNKNDELMGATKHVFCISLYNRDINKRVDVDSLMKRIDILHKLGYDVIIDCFGEYHYSYTSIINNVDYKESMNIHYVMGSDIMQRFLQDENVMLCMDSDGDEAINVFNNRWNQCTFWYGTRPGFVDLVVDAKLKHVNRFDIEYSELSSTQIRVMLIDGDIEGIEGYVGIQLTQLYIEFYAVNAVNK